CVCVNPHFTCIHLKSKTDYRPAVITRTAEFTKMSIPPEWMCVCVCVCGCVGVCVCVVVRTVIVSHRWLTALQHSVIPVAPSIICQQIRFLFSSVLILRSSLLL